MGGFLEDFLREHEPSEKKKKIYRKLGVGPFILGKLKGRVIDGEVAKELLKETPPWDTERRKYLMHVIEEGERAKKQLEEILREMKRLTESEELDE